MIRAGRARLNGGRQAATAAVDAFEGLTGSVRPC